MIWERKFPASRRVVSRNGELFWRSGYLIPSNCHPRLGKAPLGRSKSVENGDDPMPIEQSKRHVRLFDHSHALTAQCVETAAKPRLDFRNNSVPNFHRRGTGHPVVEWPKPTAKTPRIGWHFLGSQNADQVLLHFQSLSDDAFRQRFGTAWSHHWLDKHLAAFFARPGFAIGVFKSLQLVAIGEVRPAKRGGSNTCEFGVSVADTERRRGLGLEITNIMRREAKRRGFEFAEAFVECSNTRMCAVLRHFERTSKRYGSTLYFQMPL